MTFPAEIPRPVFVWRGRLSKLSRVVPETQDFTERLRYCLIGGAR